MSASAPTSLHRTRYAKEGDASVARWAPVSFSRLRTTAENYRMNNSMADDKVAAKRQDALRCTYRSLPTCSTRAESQSLYSREIN